MNDIIRQTMKGKTVQRILFNRALKKFLVSGEVLDLGAGNKRSSYFEYLPVASSSRITSLDKLPDRHPDIIADLEEGLLGVNTQFDFVLCFNLLEHIFNYQSLVDDVYRVLVARGTFIGYVPFLVRYHPDPHDFFRYTPEALQKILAHAGFSEMRIDFIGKGPFTAAWNQYDHVFERGTRWVRWLVTFAAFGLDWFLIRLRPKWYRERYPLGYLFVAKKQ